MLQFDLTQNNNNKNIAATDVNKEGEEETKCGNLEFTARMVQFGSQVGCQRAEWQTLQWCCARLRRRVVVQSSRLLRNHL